MGGTAAHSSGDLFFAFATGNRGLASSEREVGIRMLSDAEITPFYDAVIDSTEEAIINAMLGAETMTGADYWRAHAIPHDQVQAVLRKHGRLVDRR
jgi:D-aminopeptidase